MRGHVDARYDRASDRRPHERSMTLDVFFGLRIDAEHSALKIARSFIGYRWEDRTRHMCALRNVG